MHPSVFTLCLFDVPLVGKREVVLIKLCCPKLWWGCSFWISHLQQANRAVTLAVGVALVCMCGKIFCFFFVLFLFFACADNCHLSWWTTFSVFWIADVIIRAWHSWTHGTSYGNLWGHHKEDTHNITKNKTQIQCFPTGNQNPPTNKNREKVDHNGHWQRTWSCYHRNTKTVQHSTQRTPKWSKKLPGNHKSTHRNTKPLNISLHM